MSVEAVDKIGVSEAQGTDEDDKSEEENGADDLKCLDWLVNYRLPEYFACYDDSFHHFTEKNLFCNSNNGYFPNDLKCEDKDQVPGKQMICNTPKRVANLENFQASSIYLHWNHEKRIKKKCSLLCWIYRVLATSPERQLSLNDIYRHFIVLNPDWVKLSSKWKFSVGKILFTSKCFINKDSLWSINADFALKHESAALAQGFSHRCPPSVSSISPIDMLKNFQLQNEIKAWIIAEQFREMKKT